MNRISYSPKVGDRHGRLTVVFVIRAGSGWACKCLCKCGRIRTFPACQLYYPKQRHNSACGVCSGNLRHGHKTNKRSSPEYATWRGMLARCYQNSSPSWKYYGERGIRVCERWRRFETFLADMGPRPSLSHSIDRYPDKNGNYEPGNCRWATEKQQGRNRRDNRFLTCDGKTMTVTDWADTLGVGKSFLFNRLFQGWSHERTIKEPKH